MSNRFVQYKPLDYTPVTEPLEILKESLVNRRKLIDTMEDQQDKLALVRAQGIDGTDWQNKAVEQNRWLDSLRTEAANYLMENSGDLYGAKRKIREVQNKIVQASTSGELGAINNAYASYAKQMEELQKAAGKKDSYSLSRLEKQNQLFKMQSQDLGKFNPIRGTYERATSFTAPPAEFDVYGRLTDVVKNTPALTGYDLVSGRDGWQIIDKVTGVEHKDSATLVTNMLNSLKTDSHYKDDLDWQTRYMAVSNKLDMSKPENQQLMAEWAAQKMANDAKGIEGYAYTKELEPKIHRMEDPALKIQLQREKIAADKKIAEQFKAPDIGIPSAAEIDYLSNNPTLEDAGAYWNQLTGLVNKSATTVFGGPGLAPSSLRSGQAINNLVFDNEKLNLNRLDSKQLSSLNKEMGKNLKIDSGDLSTFMDKYKKANPSANYKDGIKAFVQEKKNIGFQKDPIKGYEIPFDERGDRTIDLVSNPQYRVYVTKNGRVVDNGEDYTMGKLIEDRRKILGVPTNVFAKQEMGKFRTTHFVPPSEQIPEYTYKMTGPDGETIYVAPTKKYNDNNQTSFKNTAAQYQKMKRYPSEANSTLVVPGAYDSNIGQSVEQVLRQHGTSLTKYGDPRNIVGWKVVPTRSHSNGREEGANNIAYSKVHAIFQDPLTGHQRTVTVYSPNKSSLSNSLDIDNEVQADIEMLHQELFKREVADPKVKWIKDHPYPFQQLQSIFN